jgi:Rps23 Pro-64 3,4-dihydroxylase Tpa1-like proline 4-hydroxylase
MSGDGALDPALAPLDVDRLRDEFDSHQPVRWICIDGFLEPELAREIRRSFPSFEQARALGREFRAVNETQKVQISDPAHFSAAALRLHDALASPAWLAALSTITGIPDLLADPELTGGGLHLYGSGARLDVHVDFNLIRDRGLYRRLNILVFFNEGWESGWGGEFELWDRHVRERLQALPPLFNRCVVFETSELSFHGVPKVTAPPGTARLSFAAYYYTREAPAGWEGRFHTTVFRARPDEWLRRHLLMPLESAGRALRRGVRRVGRELLGR